MQLNVQIDVNKSNLFLDLLEVLKKDNMIDDFQVLSTESDGKKLNSYEKELLKDISGLSGAVKDADDEKGVDTSIYVTVE